MSERVLSRRWQLAIRLTVAALVWSVGLVLAAPCSAPKGQTVSSDTGVTLTTRTFVQVNGLGSLVLVAIPLVACLSTGAALWHRHHRQPAWSGPAAWAAARLVAIEALWGIATIGAVPDPGRRPPRAQRPARPRAGRPAGARAGRWFTGDRKLTSLQPETLRLKPDGGIPKLRLPVLIYHDLETARDAAGAESAFAEHGWRGAWRNGIFSFHHFHPPPTRSWRSSPAACACGWADPPGRSLEVRRGDVLVLPAGTGHRNEGDSGDLLVVGAYPNGMAWDLATGPRAKYGRS